MAIQPLDPLVVNQIAAGEVIDRPASVVKELVENSLDASAGAVEVQVEDGGRSTIRVSDDGDGIPAEELPLAVASHATSKIREAEELAAVRSMGFRGEALASIAAVSQLRVRSRPRDADAGATIEAAGADVGTPTPTGAAPGTVVEVRNLFFNMPARRKFLRAASTEISHISETLLRLAAANPRVGFRLVHNGRRSLDLPRGEERGRRCRALFGEEVGKASHEFESEEDGIALWGMAGPPSMARSSTRYQYIYCNGRPIRDRNIGHAIKEAYRGLIEPSQHPMVVLFLRLSPDAVDVNVHPKKGEVRFANARAVHGHVHATIRGRLLEEDLTPAGSVPDPSADSTPAGEGGSTERVPAGVAETPTAVRGFAEAFQQGVPQQKGFDYSEVQRAMGAASPSAEEAPTGTAAAEESSEPSVLQVHDAYIVTQDEAGILIIDQHALHERMIFESLRSRVERAGELERQRLLTPVSVLVPGDHLDVLEQLRPLLNKLGIEAEAMGPETIGIHAFPTLLFDRGVDPAEFLRSLLERAGQDGFAPNEEGAIHEALDMMSCKAAVKAGDRLRPEELQQLLRRRHEFERHSACPHGRPTTIRLTRRDLDRQFKRA